MLWVGRFAGSFVLGGCDTTTPRPDNDFWLDLSAQCLVSVNPVVMRTRRGAPGDRLLVGPAGMGEWDNSSTCFPFHWLGTFIPARGIAALLGAQAASSARGVSVPMRDVMSGAQRRRCRNRRGTWTQSTPGSLDRDSSPAQAHGPVISVKDHVAFCPSVDLRLSTVRGGSKHAEGVLCLGRRRSTTWPGGQEIAPERGKHGVHGLRPLIFLISLQIWPGGGTWSVGRGTSVICALFTPLDNSNAQCLLRYLHLRPCKPGVFCRFDCHGQRTICALGGVCPTPSCPP